MSALTNRLPTRASRVVVTRQVKEKSVPWREVFASEIAEGKAMARRLAKLFDVNYRVFL